jgi:hypothetical protein
MDKNKMMSAGRADLAKFMERDAKAFYRRYTAGDRLSPSVMLLMTSFGVWLHNEHYVVAYERLEAENAELKTRLAKHETLLSSTESLVLDSGERIVRGRHDYCIDDVNGREDIHLLVGYRKSILEAWEDISQGYAALQSDGDKR